MRYWIGFLITAVVASLVLDLATKTDIGAYLVAGVLILGAITLIVWLIAGGILRTARRRF